MASERLRASEAPAAREVSIDPLAVTIYDLYLARWLAHGAAGRK